MGRKLDLVGQRYGRLLVIKEAGRDKHGNVLWLCKCSCPCGTEVTVSCAPLRKGDIRSCGCLRREKSSELLTKHGITKSNPRLYRSITEHFKLIRQGWYGYRNWTLDARYTDNVEGVVKFCRDVIALQPEACARYEIDKSLDMDKDNDAENIFRPESIVFMSSLENRSKHFNNLKLDDGCSLSEFCRRVGIQTCKNGKCTDKYSRICNMYRRSHKPHPELIKRANELIALFTKCLKLLELHKDVRSFAAVAGIPLRSTQQ